MLLYRPQWKDNEITTVEDWIIKLMELAEMAEFVDQFGQTKNDKTFFFKRRLETWIIR